MISFLFLSRVASRWLARRREHAPWKPRQSECSAVWEAPSLKPHQAVSDESLHIAAKSSSSWPILLEGYLYFRLKANLLLLWEAKCPAVSHRAAGWSTHSFCVPFSWFALPPFGLFTIGSVGHILLGHPPSPATSRHNLQLSYRVRDETRRSLPAPRIPAAKRGPRCAWWCPGRLRFAP